MLVGTNNQSSQDTEDKFKTSRKKAPCKLVIGAGVTKSANPTHFREGSKKIELHIAKITILELC